jgi:predicted house-cleaning NTP pyrophosphatase (Maf/HAM1 superfamily)
MDQAHAVTAVRMDRLPKPVIDAYAASRLWEGKAGGYGIQDAPLAPFIRLQSGPWSNVVGLPLGITRDLLRRNNIVVRDPPDEASLQQNNPFASLEKAP